MYLILSHFLLHLRVFSRCPCGHPLPCWQQFRIRVSCVGKVCCSASSCVAYELVASVLVLVSCVSHAARPFSISRAFPDYRGCARSRNVPIVGLIFTLSLLRLASCRTFWSSSSVAGSNCFIASRASRSGHRAHPPSPFDVRIVYTSCLDISRILAFLLVAVFSGFPKWCE